MSEVYVIQDEQVTTKKRISTYTATNTLVPLSVCLWTKDLIQRILPAEVITTSNRNIA